MIAVGRRSLLSSTAAAAVLVLGLAACSGGDEESTSAPDTPVDRTLEVGRLGEFRIELDDPVHAAPGANVLGLLPVPASPDAGDDAFDLLFGPAQAFVGRVADTEERGTLLLREPEGSWDETTFDVETRRPARVSEAFRTGLAAWRSVESGAPGLRGFLQLLAEAVEPTAERARAAAIPGPVDTPEAAPRPPEEGASLAAWAPADCIYVRFRSVESAYRAVHQLDAVLGRVLARGGDARELGTSKLTLHDLLLPTIWRTNPGAERGVGELAVVLAPPFRRGRLRVALVMRVVDPELHYMQTEAGLHQESQEDHLWRPEGDPFPELRDRRNHRERLLDVEVVATDGSLLRHVLTAERRVADDPAYRARRGESLDGDEPPRGEAAFAFVPEAARAAFEATGGDGATADRERLTEGLRELVARWTGLDRPLAAAGDLGLPAAYTFPGAWLGGRVDYGADGSSVELWFDDATVAGRVAERLRAAPDEDDLLAAACLRSLEDLTALTLVEPRQRLVGDRAFVVLGWRPVCPCGGRHRVDPTTGRPSCSVHRHPGRPRATEAPAWMVEDVTVDGSDLRLRIPLRRGSGK